MIRNLTGTLCLTIAVLLGVTGCSSSVSAAIVKLGKIYDNDPAIDLDGEIKKGDLKQIITLAHKIVSEDKILYLVINSKGGDLSEAIKIGKFARATLTRVVISGNLIRRGSNKGPRYCYSACIFIYIGAATRDHQGDNLFFTERGNPIWESKKGRKIQKSIPVIGIHRPYYEKERYSELSIQEAEKKYRNMDSKVRYFLRESGAPDSFITELFNTPSLDIKLIKKEKFIKIIPYKTPYLQEWYISKCGALSKNDISDLGIIYGDRISFGNDRYTPKGMSKGYVDYLLKKSKTIDRCKSHSIKTHQKNLLENYRAQTK